MGDVDDRFAKTPGYLFGAMSFVEAERLRANANLTGMRGKRKVGPDGHVSYQVEDPCTVFEKIPGTPKYWQRVRYEIIAKLENNGPFHLFFTLEDPWHHENNGYLIHCLEVLERSYEEHYVQ